MGPKTLEMKTPPFTQIRDNRSIRAIFARALGLTLVVFLWSGTTPTPAVAFDDVADRFEDEAGPAEPWRTDGIGHLKLPLGFRARFETNYTRHNSLSDRLASQFVGRYAALTGPGPIIERSLDSRLSLSHPLWERIDLEIAWETRNRVAVNQPMQIQRHMIGALIRITP